MARKRRASVWAGFAAAVLAAGVLAAAPAGAAPRDWSVSFETATASGTGHIERPPNTIFGTYVITGDLRNSGDGCYSLWTGVARDLIPPRYSRTATVCGEGDAPVEARFPSYAPTSTAYGKVCRGETHDHCGSPRPL
ncbi:hypothetical protein SAMN05421810_107112 [Amycolatopsis arida]|uniref:Secreted protein n=1 Tax=Amycolatopsis arida TaxID=587909 RepID=A0A1I5YEZ3_9PSEU|nr:hypothetical protein [Amycolatopsis arida]TDX90468.1 hypothetical protein CLV69_107112 [Amycolatopsis arida]SFQ42794.1 hypothetical protein SAMN05421810_107112 [Amycolatopsis arida]